MMRCNENNYLPAGRFHRTRIYYNIAFRFDVMLWGILLHSAQWRAYIIVRSAVYIILWVA